MKLFRGFFALILALILESSAFAEYLHRDDVIKNPKFTEKIEQLGLELEQITGVSLRLAVVQKLPKGMDMLQFESSLLQEMRGPTVLLTFAQLNSEIDIAVNDSTLYKLFDKGQVLSPAASVAQALVMGVMFAKSWNDFKELLHNSGGTILPLLGAKAKEGEEIGKYSAALFNGYSDIAGQIAESKGVVLKQGNRQGSKNVMTVVKVAFYGVIAMALVMYFRRVIYRVRKYDGTH